MLYSRESFLEELTVFFDRLLHVFSQPNDPDQVGYRHQSYGDAGQGPDDGGILKSRKEKGNDIDDAVVYHGFRTE